jgi:hypothetical protein
VEAAEAAMESLKERVAELEVEANVWREREEEATNTGEALCLLIFGTRLLTFWGTETEMASSGRPVSGTEHTSVAWIQLEKQNERLKDALARLVEIRVLVLARAISDRSTGFAT